MNNIKQKRISSEIQKALMEIIFNDAKDELLRSITITSCEVTNDLSFCKVYFTSLLDMDHKNMEKELNDDTATYLRSELAKTIDIRNTPELLFKYDNSIAYGDNIEKIIQKIHEDK
jgi:ribosome-binding factor A